jgi:hypothetical protein
MVRWVYAMLLATALALALVWQGAGMRQTGYDLARLGEQMADQKAQSAMLEAHLSKLASPQRVTTLVAYLGLDLQPPAPAAGSGQIAIAQRTTPAAPAAHAAGSIGPGTVSVAAAPGF